MSAHIADYEVTGTVPGDGTLPCLRARSPQRLGRADSAATVWVLGPVARTSWAAASARLTAAAAVRGPFLPEWLEAGVAEWAQRPVVWLSAGTRVSGSLAAAPTATPVPDRLRAVASAARAAHALHENGLLHGAICPHAVAFVESGSPDGSAPAVLAPPALADGAHPLAQIGYPPISYVDPQLLRGQGGRWSDIWSLGATARYAATGSSPFPGMEDLPVVRALAQLLTSPAPVPVPASPATEGAAAGPSLPEPLSALIDSCLSEDPEARPATAGEVAERLEEAASKW